MAQQYPVRELCALLEVTRSGYYAWHNGRETARDIANRLWTERIRGVYHQKKGRYGSPRVTEQLRREGHRCDHKRVERLMRQQGLKGCSSRKRRVCTTNSEHDQPIAPNLLLNRPAPSGSNEVWVATLPTCHSQGNRFQRFLPRNAHPAPPTEVVHTVPP